MQLDWPDCRNVRDLGGLPTLDGRTIRPGALLRSDSHHLLTPEAVRTVRDSAVSRILDLRWARELERNPSPFAADPVYRHVPLLMDVLDYEIDPDTYGPLLDHNQPQIRTAFGELAAAPPGGVVVHCHGGRDRTGTLIALTLGLAGVPAPIIAADYALTADSPATRMRNTLRHLDDVYGGAEAYLRRSGVTQRQVDAARARLIA